MHRVLTPRAVSALCALLLTLGSPLAVAEERSGASDFDFAIGTWRTQVRRRLRPLTGSEVWTEMKGTTVTRKVWDGRANLVELVAEGPGGRFEGLNLRLYNPKTRQWSLHFAASHDGALDAPTVGGFKDGRGEFYSQERYNDRVIFVRFVITIVSRNEVRYEQAFSDDGGKTWELNWIALDTRVPAVE